MAGAFVQQDKQTSLEPLTVRIPEAMRLTGIGRSKLYELIQDHRVATVKLDGMTLIRVDSLRQLIDSADCHVADRQLPLRQRIASAAECAAHLLCAISVIEPPQDGS